MKTIVCPECGEIIPVNPDEVELFSQIVCEGCFSTLEIIEENPFVAAVVESESDEIDDDDYDEDEDEDE